jgi:hypothetical protein
MIRQTLDRIRKLKLRRRKAKAARSACPEILARRAEDDLLDTHARQGTDPAGAESASE